MNRRYALIWLVALATTAFAQTTTEAPNQRLRQLEENLQEQGYKMSFWQTNADANKISYSWSIAPYVKGSAVTYKSMPDSIIAWRQHRLGRAFEAIREAFTDLGKEATESQQYECHKNGTDTIEYALGFMDPEFKRKQNSSVNDLRMNFIFHAHEYASFYYRKNVEGWDASNYYHVHVAHNDVAPEDMKPFDVAAFEAQIQPVLKSAMTLKGAYSCPFVWRHDKGFKEDADEPLHSIYFSDGVYDYGLATGTRYFIPAQYKDEANRLFLQLQSLASGYVNQHQDQYYHYFHSAELPYPDVDDESRWRIDNTFNHRILRGLLSVKERPSSKKSYFLFFIRHGEGLHIFSFSGDGEIWMPKEWYKVKSYINGKLVYLKEAEQEGNGQAVAEAIAAKQWRIDVNMMNTMRYGSRTVTPDFYLELRGGTLHSYLPYMGQARVSPTLSPSIGLNFEKPVLKYKESMPKSKKYTQIDIDVRTQEDSYHYVIEIYDSGEATIRVQSLNRDPISFDGTMTSSQ